MDSLIFTEIDDRELSIGAAYGQSCRWFLEREEFTDWLDDDATSGHTPFLWVKGKPGSGKSTLMKTVHDWTRANHNAPDRAIISFFFVSRGTNLQRSTVGLYRSLLVQLLTHFEDLQIIFDSRPKRTPGNWTTVFLKALFLQAVRLLRQRQVLVFIDAVDECPIHDIQDMLDLLDDQLADARFDSQIRLKVFLTSRHYPHLSVEHGAVIVLDTEPGHIEDIKGYISRYLRLNNKDLVYSIGDDILRRSAGVFLWAVLVVQILKREDARGKIYSFQSLGAYLDRLPVGLEEIFNELLARTDTDHWQFLCCIRLILFSRVPLSLDEFYWAMNAEHMAVEHMQAWFEMEIDLDVMGRFLIDCCMGLAEVTVTYHVQFVHEVVREYLVSDACLKRFNFDASTTFIGSSHEYLKRKCWNYLQLCRSISISDEIGKTERLTLEENRARSIASMDIPFLGYAVQHVLWHSDKAAHFGLDQVLFLNELDPCTLIPMKAACGTGHTRRASLLYVLVVDGLFDLIKILCCFLPSIDMIGEEYGSPLSAAIQLHRRDIVHVLTSSATLILWEYVSEGLVSLPDGDPHRSLVDTIMEIGGWRLRLEEVILAWAAKYSTAALISHWLSREASLTGFPTILSDFMNALRSERRFENPEYVRSIAQNLTIPDCIMILKDACSTGNERLVRYLAEHCPEACERALRGLGNRPLMDSARNNYARLLRFVLSLQSLATSSRNALYRELLQAAQENHAEDVIQYLQETGVDLYYSSIGTRNTVPIWM